MSPVISLGLWTLRNHLNSRTELAVTLARVREIGFETVEFSGDCPDASVQEVRQVLDDSGIVCPSSHRTWRALRDNTDAEIDFLKTLGCKYVAVPIINDEYADRYAYGSYRALLADMPPVTEKLKVAGITLGYHHHSYEFIRGSGGATILDLLIEEGGRDLAITVDVYWAAAAGANPAKLIDRLHGRVPVIHMKDMGVAFKGNEWVPPRIVAPGMEENEWLPSQIFAPVGEGNLDWDSVIPAAQAAGSRMLVVEQDICRRDPFDCVRSSFEFLKARL